MPAATQDYMRAVLLSGFGGLEKLTLAEVPRPAPAAGEVLIEVGACGLNNTDLNLRKGWYGAGAEAGWKQGATDFPIIQGADVVGRVVAVGEAVSTNRIGERVMVNPTIYNAGFETNPMNIDFIGSERPGGFAEYVAVPTENAVAVASDWRDAQLATFATSYLTAEHMLTRAAVQAGETVLVTGASGGVGSALLQLVRARGAQAIGIVGAGKEAFARDLGAIAVIPRDVADITAALADYRVDVVADVVGGAGFAALMDATRPGGRVVTCGAIAGPLVEIDLRKLYLRHLSLIGSTLGTQAEFEALVGYIQAEKIQPLLAQTFPLKDMAQAQQTFEAKGYFGKIVITIADD
jgi:NADPH:quinone reductase-like Zn-dependent oxidoreductase